MSGQHGPAVRPRVVLPPLVEELGHAQYRLQAPKRQSDFILGAGAKSEDENGRGMHQRKPALIQEVPIAAYQRKVVPPSVGAMIFIRVTKKVYLLCGSDSCAGRPKQTGGLAWKILVSIEACLCAPPNVSNDFGNLILRRRIGGHDLLYVCPHYESLRYLVRLYCGADKRSRAKRLPFSTSIFTICSACERAVTSGEPSKARRTAST